MERGGNDGALWSYLGHKEREHNDKEKQRKGRKYKRKCR